MIEQDANVIGLIRSWHVVFRDSRARSFWNLFTSSGYRHVAAYGYSPDKGVWIVLDPGQDFMAVQVLNQDELAAWVEAHARFTSAILRIDAGQGGHAASRFGHTCVTAIKRLIGLPSGAFTPRGLFHEMRRHGAEDVFVGRQPKRTLISWLTLAPMSLNRLRQKIKRKPA